MTELTVAELISCRAELKVGDRIYLTGEIYTARDAAHKRIFALMKENKLLPFDIKDSVIYYAGPTPAKGDRPIKRPELCPLFSDARATFEGYIPPG